MKNLVNKKFIGIILSVAMILSTLSSSYVFAVDAVVGGVYSKNSVASNPDLSQNLPSAAHSTNNSAYSNFGYAGQYHDVETGFIYLRGRYYNPATGRFINEDPIRDGLNWYTYCNNDPINFVDSSGLDAIVITSDAAAASSSFGPFGHTSAIYQNVDGKWFYTYWGNNAVAVIAMPDTIVGENGLQQNSMGSLSSFNTALNQFLSKHKFKNITSNYTHATYVVGDFTQSLHQAYLDVQKAYHGTHNMFRGTIEYVDGGSHVYQGVNGPYNLLLNNCFDRTYASLSKGTLADGTNAKKYMNALGFDGGMIPNLNTKEFAIAFMNDSFTFDLAGTDMKKYYDIFGNSPFLSDFRTKYYNSIVKR